LRDLLISKITTLAEVDQLVAEVKEIAGDLRDKIVNQRWTF
jgi:hypothetical protein